MQSSISKAFLVLCFYNIFAVCHNKLLVFDCWFPEVSPSNPGNFTEAISLTFNTTCMGSFSESSLSGEQLWEQVCLWDFCLNLESLLGGVIWWEFCYLGVKSFKHRQYHFDIVNSEPAIKLLNFIKPQNSLFSTNYVSSYWIHPLFN